MKLSKTLWKIVAVAAVLPWIAFGATAQTKSAKTPAKKVKPAVVTTTSAKAAAPAAPAPAAATVASKRDPFVALINDKKESSGPDHLPPGKAGLVVATVRIDGTTSSPNGMIAVVSNPEQHVYFIREGDHLYDGDVEKINSDGVTFRENSKDAFGKPVERVVTKRIYPSAGE